MPVRAPDADVGTADVPVHPGERLRRLDDRYLPRVPPGSEWRWYAATAIGSMVPAAVGAPGYVLPASLLGLLAAYRAGVARADSRWSGGGT